jgi:hypothetical protein
MQLGPWLIDVNHGAGAQAHARLALLLRIGFQQAPAPRIVRAAGEILHRRLQHRIGFARFLSPGHPLT